MIRKLSLPHLTSSEDSYDCSCVFVLIRVLPPLSGTALASWLAPSSVFPCMRGDQAQQAPPSAAPPRCPDDCPACRLASPATSGTGPAPLAVRPWSEVKSRRRAPKRIPTAGFACPNRQCTYFGITDAHIHAAFRRWQAWPGRADPD